jgi:hypothetical protein
VYEQQPLLYRAMHRYQKHFAISVPASSASD